MMEPAIYRNGIIRGQVSLMTLNTDNEYDYASNAVSASFWQITDPIYVNKNRTIIKQTTSELVFVSMETVKFKTQMYL